MKISDRGIAFIKEWEGVKLTAYKDGGGVWTIGVGHTGPDVHQGLVWTEFEVDEHLRMDLEDHDISPLLGDAKTSQNQYDAMSSLAFNIGMDHFRGSTVLKRHKLGNPVGAANAFALWRYDNGKIIAGLVRRREAERRLYLTGI